MKLWSNLKTYFKKHLTPLIIGMLGVGITGGAVYVNNLQSKKVKPRQEKVSKDSIKSAVPVIKSPLLRVRYNTDTLDHAISTLLFYSVGKITRYYVENNNGYRMQLPYFAHEEWHRHNDESKYRTRYAFTPLEYFRLCMHDEISANMAAVLTARYEYLAAPTKEEKNKIINRYKNSYMKFYFDELAAGKIKPESLNPFDIEREHSLIANGTMKMWMKTYFGHYAPTMYRMLQRYIGRAGLINKSGKNYQKILNHMYNIGGVNFAEYFNHDIEIKDTKVLLTEQLPKIRFMRSGGADIMNIVTQNYSLMTSVGAEKQTEALQHLLISSQLKYMLRNKTKEELQQNPQLVNLCFRKVINSAYSDKSFKNMVEAFPIFNTDCINLHIKDANFVENIHKMFMFRELDLTTMIADFSVEKVPIKSMYNSRNIIADNIKHEDFVMEFFLYPQLAARLEKTSYVPLINTPLLAPQTPNKRSRMSPELYINVPNLREPILLSASPNDKAVIYAALRAFDAVPDVFKGCNLAAQKKYLAEHKEYQDSLKLLHTTGSVNIAAFMKDHTPKR